jgi:putative ubiquitin-RnfH superfamily antitoxin RatB of RatAB toxin-antitoxin module
MVKQDTQVEVAFATPDKQLLIPVKLTEGASVQQAINKSGILDEIFEIDLGKMSVGIFGSICKLDQIIVEGDRVEIYRHLLTTPMDARRNRAGEK